MCGASEALGRADGPPRGHACRPACLPARLSACPPAQSGCDISPRLCDVSHQGATNSRNFMLTVDETSCGSRATFRSKQVSGRRWMAPDGGGQGRRSPSRSELCISKLTWAAHSTPLADSAPNRSQRQSQSIALETEAAERKEGEGCLLDTGEVRRRRKKWDAKSG